MSKKIAKSHPTRAVISDRDPLWAIVAALPADALQWCKQQLLEDVREEDLEIVSGKDEITAMLAFAETSEIGEDTALELSAKYETVTYLLDFDEYAELTRQYQVRVQRQEGHPVAFLEARGIVPPSHRPDPDSDDTAVREFLLELANALDPRSNQQPEESIHITEDLQWAIVAAFPAEDLEWCQRQLPWPLSKQGSQVIAGARGFSALLGYGGSNDLWMSVAVRFSELLKTSTYLLDFRGDESSIKRLDVRVRRNKVPPAEFLAEHGIEVFVHKPPSVWWKFIGVIDGVTLDQAREQTLPGERHLLHANKRGVLVDHDCLADEIGIQLERTSYTLLYDQIGGAKFSCQVLEPGKRVVKFDPEGSAPDYEPIDSVLGETTLDGILRVLDIPRDLLLAKPAARPMRMYIEGRLTLFGSEPDEPEGKSKSKPKSKSKSKPKTKSKPKSDASARKPRQQSSRSRMK